MNPVYETLRQESFDWICQAGQLSLDLFGRVGVQRKADRSPVTEADLAVQELLLAQIARRFPADAVITEETQSNPAAHARVSQSSRCWIVDPIDGTRNYARSIPLYTIAVALMEQGEVVVGWVYDPVAERMYSASRGGGAWLNDTRVAAPTPDCPDEVYISIPTSRHEQLPRIIHEWIDRMIVRNFGTTALHMVLLGTGSLDAVYCKKSKLWDIAAGALFAAETGAETRLLTGEACFPMNLADYANEPLPFLAARQPLLNQLLDEYRQAALA